MLPSALIQDDPATLLYRGNNRGGSYEATSACSETISLLRRIREGDQRALQKLYDSTGGSVYALARAILRNSEDAKEVVCDTYAQAWRQSERFDAERSSPIGWLLMMCRTRALDRLRQNSGRRSLIVRILSSTCEIADDAPAPDELLSLFQSNSRIQQAMKALSPKRLQLIGLAFFEGLTFSEVADRTGMPLGTVKSHIRRALLELRHELQHSDL